MKKKLRFKDFLKSFLLLAFLALGQLGFGQVWNYDFGTGTGSFSSSTASTSFLPSPTSGTARVRVGTNPGSIVLANPGISLGSTSEMQFTSNTGSTSTTKMSIYDYTAAKVGYAKFKIAFNGGTNGVYYFTMGDGANFSDSNTMAVNQTFAGIQFTFGASNQITYNVISAGAYVSTGITNPTTLFSQSTSNEYLVEVYMNNNTTTANYFRSGSISLANATWDLWVNGVKVGANLAKGNLAANTNIDSFAFNHQSSSSAPGTLYIDDIEYSNTLPSIPTYALTYNGNTNTGGTTQTTANYAEAATVTVAGAGSLVKTGFTFNGWNTVANGSGTSYAVGATFAMPANTVALFAQWIPSTSPNLTITGTLNEATLNNATVALTLANETFADATLLNSNFSLANAPSGVSVESVTYNSATSATLTLAYNDTDFDVNVTTFNITIAGAELTLANALTSDNLIITAVSETLTVGAITSFGNQCINVLSLEQSFAISGSNLKAGTISLAALSGFTYSETSNGAYTSTLSFSNTAGTLTSKTIFVKFLPTAVQSYSSNIVVSSIGAPSVNGSVVGSGINTLPTTSTPSSATLTYNSATLGGNITTQGCSTITERGIYYSTTSVFADGTGTKVSTVGTYSTGIFTIPVTGLTSNTVYYYKAFALSASGTSYSAQGTFTTSVISASVANAASAISDTSFEANWDVVAGSTGYRLDVSTFSNFVSNSYTDLASWNFPNNPDDATADSGITANINNVISVGGGVTNLIFSPNGATTNSANANGWVSGSGTKFWEVNFSTQNYYGIIVSSKQRGSNTAPRDFKLQYKIGLGGTYADVSGGSVTVANDYTSGVLLGVTLPSDCDNQLSVYLRWVMTSNTNINNGTVASAGSANIDDIVVEGKYGDFVPGYNNLAVTGVSQLVSILESGTKYYYRVRTTDAGSVSVNSNVIEVTTTGNVKWTSNTDTNWSTASNWSNNAVPDGTKDIEIPFGNPILATNFTVQTGKNLTISGTGALTLFPAASLTIQGTANFNDKAITFKSDATGTAMLGEVTGTLTGATNVTVERYIPARRVWRALTAPLKGANGSLYATWQNGGAFAANTGVEIWGPAGTTMATGPNYSVLNYTPTGWSSVTNTTTANLFDATRNNAYLVFVTGGYGSGNIASTTPATATTLKATGQLITGDVAYDNLINTKHTLIGNPYASSLSPSTLLSGATNLVDKFWVYDPILGTAGGYVSYDMGTYSNITGSYSATTAIQSGQAFFVRATPGTTGSFTISENKKSTGVTNVFGKEANQSVNNSVNASILRVGMYKESNQQWKPLDGAIAGFYSTANNLVDDNDGKKFANGSENIAFVRNNTTLSSEHFAIPQPLDELYMRVWNTSVNNYKLQINTESFTVPNIEATLIDLFTGVQTPINLDGTVQEYPFAVTSATASTGDRFKVVFSASALATTTLDIKSIKVYPNPVTNGIVNVQLPEGDYANYSYELVNVLGQTVRSANIEVLSGNQFSFNTRGLANTWYALRILNKGKAVYQTKVIIAN